MLNQLDVKEVNTYQSPIAGMNLSCLYRQIISGQDSPCKDAAGLEQFGYKCIVLCSTSPQCWLPVRILEAPFCSGERRQIMFAVIRCQQVAGRIA